MLKKELVLQKMKAIDEYVNSLEASIRGNSVHDILHNEVMLGFVERRFQLVVDTMLELNTHIISAQDFPMPDDFQSTFETLGKHDVLPMDFALKLAPVVGLRNRVVHKYETLDMKLFLTNLKQNFDDFRSYLKHIDAYLTKSE